MDDFREWLSDNLRYILLGTAILVVVLILVFGIRACVRSGKSNNNGVQAEATPTVTETPNTEVAESASSGQLDQDTFPAVNTLMKDYYQALGNKDITEMRKIVSNLSVSDETRILNSNDYIDSYEVQSVYTMKGLNTGDMIAYVCFNYYCQGFTTPVPAMSQMYVITDSDGTLKILGNVSENAEISAYMQKMKEEPAVRELTQKVTDEYNAALESDSALKDFLSEFGETPETTNTSEEAAESDGSTMTANTICNVRAEADENAEIVGTLYEGEEVQKTGESGDWVQILYNGETAYVFGDLLS